ncbi:MAG: hypothetical protein ACI4XA_01755 [Oscillospiraceae bacterium]
MKEYISSFRIFAVGITKRAAITLVAFAAVQAACNLIVLFVGRESSLGDFLRGFTPMMSLLAPICGVMVVNTIFSFNHPITTGYKYFHSLSDSAAKFRRAVIVGNVLSLLIVVLFSVVGVALGNIADLGGIQYLMPAFDICMIGLVNFMGYLKSMTARVLAVIPMCMAGGFVGGFLSDEKMSGTDFLAANGTAVAVIYAVSAAVLVGGLIFSAALAEKKWDSVEVEKHEKRA